MDVVKEEGEMSDDTEMDVDDLPEIHNNECAMLNKAHVSGIVVRKLEKINASKLEERAKRFGLDLCGNRLVTQKQIDELYSNCGIESGNERHFRFEVLHLNGVDGLSTREIFEYLEDYKPISIEWIDNNSCNVVHKDHISAALALLVHSREIQNDNLKKINFDSPHHWREGMPHPKLNMVLMRFATHGDKKVSKKRADTKNLDCFERHKNAESDTKNPWGDLCKSWGVYDHQEVFLRKLPQTDYEEELEENSEVVQIKNKKLAMRLGKRSHNTEDHEDSNSDSEWKKKCKTPRMRMRADDEETKQKKNVNLEPDDDGESEVYAPLSIEVANTKVNYTPRDSSVLSAKFKNRNKSDGNLQNHGVRSRLGTKIQIQTEVYSSTDEYSSDNSDCNEQIMSRVQKVNNRVSKSSNVWSRLEEKPKDQSDLRNILRSKKKQKNSDDLRDRLGKSKQSNLRIEIDNDLLD